MMQVAQEAFAEEAIWGVDFFAGQGQLAYNFRNKVGRFLSCECRVGALASLHGFLMRVGALASVGWELHARVGSPSAELSHIEVSIIPKGQQATI